MRGEQRQLVCSAEAFNRRFAACSLGAGGGGFDVDKLHRAAAARVAGTDGTALIVFSNATDDVGRNAGIK